MAVIEKSAVDRAIKIGACNIYHGCVHNMIYEKSEDILRGLYKSASFIIQAIVANFLNLKTGGVVDFKLMSETLFTWSKKWIAESS